MNFLFLAKLSQKNPALARLCEIMIYSGVLYIISAIINWNAFSIQTFFVAFFTPALAFFGKFKRDLEDKNNNGNMSSNTPL